MWLTSWLKNPESESRDRHGRRGRRGRRDRLSIEPLESRIVPTAVNDLVANFSSNWQTGVSAIGAELQGLINTDSTFGRLVPGVTETQISGSSTVQVSPSVRQILDVNVDVDPNSKQSYSGVDSLAARFNAIDTSPFIPTNADDEAALAAMDRDGSGVVTIQEAFDVLVVGQVREYLNSANITDQNGADGITPVDLGIQLTRFLNGTLGAFQPAFHLPDYLSDRFQLGMSATNVSSGNDIKTEANLTLAFHRQDPIDLGYEADQLGFAVSPALPGSPANPVKLPVDAGVHFKKLMFGFADALDGSVSSSDFVFAAPDKPGDSGDGVVVSVEIDNSGTVDNASGGAVQRSFDVNVGFLGAGVSNGKFQLTMNAFGAASDPSNPDALGFGLSQQGAAQSSGTVLAATAPVFADLDAADIVFTLKVGNGPLAQPVEVALSKAASNNDTTAVVGSLNLALPGALAAIVTATNDGGKVRFTLTASNPSALGFGNEVLGGFTITAGNVSSLLNALPPGSPITFLLGVGGAVPKLVMVTVAGDPLGPDGQSGDAAKDADNGQVTLGSLKTSLQNALNAVFGGGALTVGDDGSQHLRITGTGVLEITHTLTLDTVDEITIAELNSTQVFSAAPAAGNTFQLDLNVAAKSGLAKPDDTAFTPTGTIKLNIDPFDTTKVRRVDVDLDPSLPGPEARAAFTLTDAGGKALAVASSGSDMQPLLDFNVISTNGVLAQINQLGNWLDRLSASDLLSKFDIPFAGTDLGTLLNFKDLVSDTLMLDDKDNTDRTDDVAKLLKWAVVNGQNTLVPVFGTAQQLAASLKSILSLTDAQLDATYAPLTKKLTYDLNLSHTLVSQTVGLDFDMFDKNVVGNLLGPLAVVQTSGQVKLEATGHFNWTMGIQMGNDAAALTTGSLLSGLNGGNGVALNDHNALTTIGLLDPVVGRLTADATFNVEVTKTAGPNPPPFVVVVTAAATADNKTVTDLVGDVNAALAASGAQSGGNGIVADSDGERIVLRVVGDPTVARFQITSAGSNPASTELGLVSAAAATVSLVAPLPVANAVPGAAVTFSLAVTRGGVTTVTPITVGTAATAGNLSVDDLVADINAALAGTDVVASQSGGFLVFSAVKADIDAFTITPSGAGASTVGLDLDGAKNQLRNVGVADAIASAVTTLAAGVAVVGKKPTGAFGVLSADATFTINGTSITVSKSGTAENPTALVRNVNAAIGATSLAGKVVADFDGLHLRLRVIDPTVASLVLAGLSASESSQLGLDNGTFDGALAFTAVRAAPVSYGVNSNATFSVTVAGGANAGTYPVTVSAAATVNDRSLFDLAATINNAIDAAFGAAGKHNPLVATVHAGQIVIGLKIGSGLGTSLIDVDGVIENGPATDAVGVTGFSVTPTNTPAVDQLKLSTATGVPNAASLADFVIFTRDGSSFSITLDSLRDSTAGSAPKLTGTIQDLIDLIATQTGSKVTLELRADKAGLTLVDHTAGANVFRLQVVNGSPAGSQLGLFGTDTTALDLDIFDPSKDTVPDGKIQGARVAVLGLLDRLFIANPASGSILSADVKLSTVDQDSNPATPDATAQATFGFVGIQIATTSANQQLLQATAGIRLAQPVVTLGQLFNAIGNITDLRGLVGLPTLTTSSNFELAVSIVPDLSLLGIPSNAKLKFNIADLGTLADVNPAQTAVKYNLPNVSVEGLNIGDLANFQAIKFDNVLDALKKVSAFLSQFAAFGFLNDDIPVLGLSVNDLISVADKFAKAVQDVEQNPAGGLQLLQQKIEEAFGLPHFSSAAARDAFFASLGIPSPTDLIAFALKDFNGAVAGNDFLRFDLRLPLGFSRGQSIDLDLGEALGVDLGPISIQGGAGLNLKAFLDARLSFGIDLNDPTKIYLFTDATGVFGGLSASADNLQFNAAIGPLGAFVRDGSVHLGVNFNLDNGSFNPASDTKVQITDIGALFGSFHPELTGTVQATLPVFFPTDSQFLGDIKLDVSGANALSLSGSNGLQLPDFSAPGVLTLPDFSAIDFAALNPFGSIPLMLDSLDFFLQGLQDAVDGEVFGIKLPLIGDQLSGAAGFIEHLRQQVLGPIRQFVEQAPQIGQELIQKILFSLLGPGSAGVTVTVPLLGNQPLYQFLGLPGDFTGLGLLVDYTTGSDNPASVTVDDIVIAAVDGPDAGTDPDDFSWKFRLSDSFKPSVDIGFDLGWDALGLAVNAGLDVNITWDLAMGLGISKTDGAYIFIGDQRQAGNAADDDELKLSMDVALKDDSNITGRLAFLQLAVTQSNADDPGLEQDDTHFHAEFGVNLVNKNNPTDQKLSFSELGSLDAKVSLSADAEVNLDVVVSFNAALIPDTVAALLPSISTRFVLDWETGNILADDFDLGESLKLVAFRDVSIDMGSFFSDFLGPIVAKVQEVTGPLQPIIDVVTAPIPVISDLAGKPVTLLDIAAAFGDVDPSMIYALADLITFVNKIPAASGSLKLVIGDFTIVDGTSDPGFKSALSNPNFDLNKDSAGFNANTFFNNALPAGFTDALSTVTNLLSGFAGNGTADLASGLLKGTEPGSHGFAFPIFEHPASIFGLLLGKDVDLITYDLAPFKMDFSYTQKFPIWGPIFGRVSMSAGLTIDLAFGYDTRGFKQFFEGGFSNPLDLLAGLYVSDTNLGTTDVPELILRGELFVGAEGNFGVLSVGVEGGIILTVNFDLYDPDHDGKVRIDELVGNFLNQLNSDKPLLAPIAIFDVYGNIAAQLRAFVESFFFKLTFDITPPITLFEFSIDFDRPPVLATVRGDGSLLLNIGPNAAQRLNGDVRDIDETIHVKSISADEVLVWGMGVPEGNAQKYKLGGNRRIVGFGGEGNDVIDLSGVTDPAFTYEIEGGTGNDTIRAAQGGGIMKGDAGNDQLFGGDGVDVIVGGEGSDHVEGGGSKDVIFGDDGTLNIDDNNTEFLYTDDKFVRIRALVGDKDGADDIHGGDGDDIIFGGGNIDTVFGDAGADLILGDGGSFDFTPAGAVPTAGGKVDVSLISARGPGAADFLYGNAGADAILGGAGDDQIDGGADDDLALGGVGFDVVYGGGGEDFLFGDENDDFIFGFRDPQGAAFGFAGDATDATADGKDYVEGGEGNDFIRGQDGADTLHGNRGGDIIFGDAGNDVIGTGTLQRPWVTDPAKQEKDNEAGSDIVYGGADDDTIDSGDGSDTVFGDDGLVVYIDFHTPAVAPFTATGSRIRTDAAGLHKLIGDGAEALIGGYDAVDDGNPQSLDLIVTAPLATDGSDHIIGGDDKDVVFGGGGLLDTIFGDFDPAVPVVGPRPSGQDTLIGDGGRIEMFGRRTAAAKAISNALDGKDAISGNDGGDYIFGGGEQDTIWGFENPPFGNSPLDGVSDNDVILGDNGQISFNPNETKNRITKIFTTVVAGDSGKSDVIQGNFGDDVILGGLNSSADVLDGSVGNDVVLGDNGELVFDSDGDLDTLDLIRSYRDGLGGGDVISGNAGNDVLIGGTGGDTMYGDDATASAGAADGEDIMLGDNADITLVGPTGRLLVQVAAMPAPTAVDLITTTDAIDAFHPTAASAEAAGGADTMSGNAKADIMLGGVNNGGVDTLYGDRAAPNATTIVNDGDDILLGDNGLLDFTLGADTNRNTLDLIRSNEDGLGGPDTISGNKGADVAIGGTGGDTIYGDDAAASAAASDSADILLGDNAHVFLVAKGAAVGGGLKVVLDAAVKTIKTTDEEHPEYGGSDTISGNAKGDIIAGGVQGDTLYGDCAIPNATTNANEGDDVILGDNGSLEWLSTGRLSEITGIDINANNPALFAKYGGAAADADLTTLDLITTEQPTSGGRDLIYGDQGRDVVFGGTDADEIHGDDGNETGSATNGDVLFGDHGRLYPQYSTLAGFNSRNFFAIDVAANKGGEGDRMFGEEGDDVMLGQQGDDRMWGGSGNDDMTGGHNVSGGADELDPAGAVSATVGAAGVNDQMDGGSGDDAMAGDNAIIWRRGDDLSPRFRALTGATIYTTTNTTIVTNVGAVSQSDPNDAVGRDIQLVDHSDAVQANSQGRFGDDVMAGGADRDTMFGELGNDTMQGDGSIAALADPGPNTVTVVTADTGLPNTGGTLYFNVPEATSDGDDYMEGNGGNDLMYGGLGQDDMIGGSSALFGLTTEVQRPDGSDTMFGGAGIDTSRNNVGDATVDANGVITTVVTGHARDADYMMGDNANVFRLVQGGASGTNPADAKDVYLTFVYDNYAGNLRIVPRAMQQLDYTLGGADFAGGTYTNGAANADNGAADLIHGESGDDVIFAMTGSDVVFGEGQDDDIVGGYGHDWISGGTGQDGVIGDDGIISTSRNNATVGEPLYGVAPLLASDPSTKDSNGNVLNEVISTPGGIQTATVNVAGELKKTIDLTPFSYDPAWNAIDDEFPDNADAKPFADDVIFGGLGSDFLHGGSGDDAVSGAEALDHAYVPVFDAGGNAVGVYDLGYAAVNLAHLNPGDGLAFNPEDLDGRHLNNRFRPGEFFLYDEYDPLRKILLTGTGELSKTGTGSEFLLNFNKAEGVVRPAGTVPKATGQQTDSYPAVNDDGADVIFGDLGNDWLVGGTGRDNMYGGWGNDLMNADDDQTTHGALNDQPDTHPTYEDRAYGGAGRDVLIANTGGDRLIDWVGEYNSYLVPYAPFGMATVSRTLQPHLHEFLYALSKADGADPTRPADTGADSARNGEPAGEMGLVLQKDFAWQDQTGAPADPQAGNIPGGKRDVLRSADFNNAQASAQDAGFFADQGLWEAKNGVLQVSATSPAGDALSVYDVTDYLPNYFEIRSTIKTAKPTGGWKANAYVVFDYFSSTDFKFAGIDISHNQIVVGYRASWGWAVSAFQNAQLKPDVYYNLLVAVNGTNVTVQLDGLTSFSYTFAPRMIDGMPYGLNQGMVGAGSDSARGLYDNFAVQVLPPQLTLETTETFDDGVANLFTGDKAGIWAVGGGRYVGTPAAGQDRAVSVVDLSIGRGLATDSYLELSAKLNTATSAGFMFDRYGPDDFKYVAINVPAGRVVVGHHTSRGWVVDQWVSRALVAGTDYTLGVAIKGSTLSVTLNGAMMFGYAFNAVAVDGGFGLLTLGGSASFDDVTIRTNDPAFAGPQNELADAPAAPAPVAAVEERSLAPIIDEAVRRWEAAGASIDALGAVRFAVADLPGLVLGQTHGTTVYIDRDAAGHGWFVDPTPADDSEFRLAGNQGERDRMDLLTVVMHELGHALGRDHEDEGVMKASLQPGTRAGIALDFAPIGALPLVLGPTPATPAEPTATEEAVAFVSTVVTEPQTDGGSAPADEPTPAPLPNGVGAETSGPVPAAIRREAGSGVAADLGRAGSGDAAVLSTGELLADGRQQAVADESHPSPLTLVAASTGVVQLIGWTPRRSPLRHEGLSADDLDELWGIDVDR